MKEPVIAPSGVSYEKEYLLLHLATNGNHEPVTRVKTTEKSVFKNENLDTLIANFKKKYLLFL